GNADVQSARFISYQRVVRSRTNTGRSGKQNSACQLVDRARQRLVCSNHSGVVSDARNAFRTACESLGGVTRMTTRKFKILDVRPILVKGVEPFSKIRDSIVAAGPEEGLWVIAPFRPAPLIEKGGGEGFKSRVERKMGGGWRVIFWREK